MARRSRSSLLIVLSILALFSSGPLQAQSFFEGIFSKAKRGIQKVVTPEPKREIRVTKEVKATKWQPKWLIRPTLSKETLLLAECSRQPPFPFSTFRYYDEIEQLPRSTQPLTVPSFGPSISIEEEGSEHPENPLDSTKLTPIFSHPDDQWIRHSGFPTGALRLDEWYWSLIHAKRGRSDNPMELFPAFLLADQDFGRIVSIENFLGIRVGIRHIRIYEPPNERVAFKMETFQVMFHFLKTLLQPTALHPVGKPEEFFTDDDHQNILGCKSALDQDGVYEPDRRPIFAYGTLPQHVDVALSHNYCERPVIILNRRHFPIDDPVKLSILFQAYLVYLYQGVDAMGTQSILTLFGDGSGLGFSDRKEWPISLFSRDTYRRVRQSHYLDPFSDYTSGVRGDWRKWDYLRSHDSGPDSPLIHEAEFYKMVTRTYLQQALFFQTLLNLEEMAPIGESYSRYPSPDMRAGQIEGIVGARQVPMRDYMASALFYYHLSQTLRHWAARLEFGSFDDELFGEIGDQVYCFYRFGQKTGRCGYKCLQDIAFHRVKRYGPCGGVVPPVREAPPGTGQVRRGLVAAGGSPSQALTPEQKEALVWLARTALKEVQDHLIQPGSFSNAFPRASMERLEKNLTCFIGYLEEQSLPICDHSRLNGGISFAEGPGNGRYYSDTGIIELDPDLVQRPLDFSSVLFHEYVHGGYENAQQDFPSDGTFSLSTETNAYQNEGALLYYTQTPYLRRNVPTGNDFLDRVLEELNSNDLFQEGLWFEKAVMRGNLGYKRAFEQQARELDMMVDTDGSKLYSFTKGVADFPVSLDSVIEVSWEAHERVLLPRATPEQRQAVADFRSARRRGARDERCGSEPGACADVCHDDPPGPHCSAYLSQQDSLCQGDLSQQNCSHCRHHDSPACRQWDRVVRERIAREDNERRRYTGGGGSGRGAGGGERRSQTERTSRPSDGGGSSGGSSEASGRPCVGGFICIIVSE